MNYSDYPFEIHGEPYAEWDRRIINEVPEHYGAIDYTKASTIVDIGAHIGAFSVYVWCQNPKAKIAAVEVNRHNKDLCRMNTLPTGARLFHAMAGYTPGEYVQWMHPEISGTNSIHKRNGNAPDIAIVEVVNAPLMTVEDICTQSGFSSIDVLKIDCEGSEYDIFANMSDECLQSIGQIIGEYHNGITRFRSEIMARLEPQFRFVSLGEVDGWGLFHCVRK